MSPRSVEPLEIAHYHPGRLRLRSNTLSNVNNDDVDSEMFERLRAVIGALKGVTSVAVHTRAGSVLVEYEPGAVDPNELIDELSQVTGLPPPLARRGGVKAQTGAARVTIGAARELNAFTENLTRGRSDLRSLVPLTLTGLAVFSFAVLPGRLPRWDNLVYWSFAVFQALHSADIARTRAKENQPP